MIYNLSWIIMRFVLTVFGRWKITGCENMPARGGVVVVSNHVSNWDPVVVGCTFNRKVHFMAKIELFKNPFIGWFLRKLGAFPLKRGQADRGAIKRSLEILQEGSVLGIFPEGTRSNSKDIQEAYNGAAMLALKAGVPILPMAVKGTKEFKNVKVKVGSPLYYPDLYNKKIDKAIISKVSEDFMGIIKNLYNELD